MAPRVLISDSLSPAAIDIFRERGVEVDFKPGLDKEALAAIIGEYDGLAIRSATKVTAKLLEVADRAEGHRAGRHRGRQCRHSGRHRQGRDRDEHALRQFDHHGRTCHRADVRPGAPDPGRRCLDPGRQVGEEPLHGGRDHRQGARHHRLRQHRLDRGQPGLGPQDAGDRLRPLPVARAGAGPRRREGRTRGPAAARRHHHPAHADDAADQKHPVGREPRQDPQGRPHHQLRPRRPYRRGGAAQAARRRPCGGRRHRRLHPGAGDAEPAVRPPQRGLHARISGPRPPRRRRMWRCRSPSRCRTT